MLEIVGFLTSHYYYYYRLLRDRCISLYLVLSLY